MLAVELNLSPGERGIIASAAPEERIGKVLEHWFNNACGLDVDWQGRIPLSWGSLLLLLENIESFQLSQEIAYALDNLEPDR